MSAINRYNDQLPDEGGSAAVSSLMLALAAPVILLLVIGGNMIKESRGQAEQLSDDFGFKTMLLLAVATSIDALAVGISFAFLSVDILPAALLIGCTTFLLSAAGCYIGRAFGTRYKAGAELAGGIILIFIGLKILLEHLGLINF